jgi:hypothetical protein
MLAQYKRRYYCAVFEGLKEKEKHNPPTSDQTSVPGQKQPGISPKTLPKKPILPDQNTPT